MMNNGAQNSTSQSVLCNCEKTCYDSHFYACLNQVVLRKWTTYTSVSNPTEPGKYTGSYTTVRHHRVKNISAKEETV